MQIIRDKNIWDKLLLSFDLTDYFFEYNYISLVNDVGGDGWVEAVYYEDNSGRCFYPYFRRSLDLPWVPKKYHNFSDITSAFGAGGYLVEGEISNFFIEWDIFVKSEKIVSEFIRHHPFFLQKELPIESEEISQFVFIDLAEFENLEALFSTFSKGCKSDVNYAKRNFVCRSIETGEFDDLFLEFSNNRSLARQYEVFKNIIKLNNCMPGVLQTYGVFVDNKITHASLFVQSKYFCHYFLSGSLERRRGAQSLIIMKAIENAWCKDVKYFSLGGGASSQDSIFQFKKSFSERTLPYNISRLIHNHDLYCECVKAKEEYFQNSSNLFPVYRAF